LPAHAIDISAAAIFSASANTHQCSPAYATNIDIDLRQIHFAKTKAIRAQRKQIRNDHNSRVNSNRLAPARKKQPISREKTIVIQIRARPIPFIKGCIKRFTYPSCDPALNARAVNTRLVIRLSSALIDMT
jgi:hypothetical protein